MAKILVVDDEESMLEVLSEMLTREGHEVRAASDGDRALEIIKENRLDLIITDIRMKPMSGMTLLKQVKKIDSDIVVIMMTAFASIETAVQAMKEGAYEYVIKPFKRGVLLLKVKRGLEQKNILDENRLLKKEIAGRYHYENIVGTSKEMQSIFRLIEKVAPTDSTVLIYGESGTGKELVARAIHYNSHRRDKPFGPINCGALPETLLESELFGHVRGSFTGAYANKEGLFEAANKGTIFLDEIGAMGPAMQMKLLRVLQEREIKRVGDTATRKIDVRIIAATNEKLIEKVKSGGFREDLFYRLSVIPVEIPPLRERKEDIPLLVKHFVNFQNRKGKTNIRISDEALYVMENYHWPGNVRELENVIERAVTLCENELITPSDFPQKLLEGQPEFIVKDKKLKTIVKDSERKHILKVLKETNGDKKETAQILGISIPSLYRKLQVLKIEHV